MSGARAWREATKEQEKGRIETSTVKRYRPGQAPEWMAEDEEEGVEGLFQVGSLKERQRGASDSLSVYHSMGRGYVIMRI